MKKISTSNSSNSIPFFVFCLLFVMADGSIKFWLTRSGLTTQIIKNGVATNASYFNSTLQYALDPLSQATMIWDGPGTNAGCEMSIRIVDSFQIKCPDNKLKLWVEADSQFNFTMTAPGYPTMTGSGTNSGKQYKFEYDEEWTCGLVFSLTLDVRNRYKSGSTKCQNNPANVAYTAACADCFCDDFPGTYWSWSTCQCTQCLLAIPGCIACNSPSNVSIVCTSCLTQKGWVLVNGICQCPGSVIVGCMQCLDPGEPCLHCNTLKHFVLTNTGTCKCASGYALVGTTCVTCSSVLSYCVTCSSSTNCLTCSSTSYAISAGNCVTCATILIGCQTCSSNTTCISCINNTYILVAGSCTTCSSLILGCNTCSAINNCLSCNGTLNFQRSGSTCVCKSGYILSGSTCTTCSSAMLGCTTCTSSSTCTACSSTNKFVLSGSSCVCQSGYALVGSTCTLCSSLINNCLTCSSSSACTSCPTNLNMEVTAGSCTCKSGYYNSSNTCISCSSTIANCVTCTSSTSCSSCTANYFVSGGTCASCIMFHPQCIDCTVSACTACDSTLNFVASAGTCTCTTPTSVASGPTCVSCSTQTGCLECSNLVDCQVCATGYLIDMSLDCQPCMAGCDVCVDSTSCTTCNIHYAYDGTACVSCGTILTGCYECTFLTTCTACDAAQHQVLNGAVCECMSGYYLNGVICSTCNSAIVGCIVCTGTTPTCSSCDSTSLYLLDSANNQCDCISGYAKDTAGVCQTCVSFLANCVTCSDNSTCTLCDTLYGVDTQTASAGQCFLCSSLINNCVECVTDATCTLCQTGYAIDSAGQCQLCSHFLPNCLQCTSNMTCTLCDPNTFGVDTVNHNCGLCSTMISGCLECSSSTECTLCDTANHFDFLGLVCDCVPPYFMAAGTTYCQECSVLQPYCLLCTGATTCSVCGNGGYLSGSVCATCPPGCTVCSSNTNCSACDSSLHFFLNDTSCLCLDGYALQGASCVGVCGDGKLALDESCDDGNLISGDGCDSTCHVETNYSCYATPGQASLCSYNKPLSLNLTNITKNSSSNTLTMNFKLGPILPNLGSLNFSQMITTDPGLKNPRFTLLPDGTLTATFDYEETLDGRPINFSISPSSVSQNFFALPSTVLTFPLQSVDNVPISHYDEATYEKQQFYDKTYQAGVYSSYGTMALGLVCDKVNGIELFGMWQVAFLSLSNINKVQPLLEPLMKLPIVNGINSHIQSHSSTVPNRVAAIGYKGEFLSNVNYMLWVVLADVVVGFGIYCIGSLIPSSIYKQKMQSAGLRILKEYLLMLIMFNTFNIGYSAGLQVSYGQQNYTLNLVAAVGSILLVISGAICVSVCRPKEYGQFKSHYRTDPASQLYFVCSIAYRLLLGFSMSQLNEFEEATIINFGISVIFMMYLITNTPYKQGYHNYRAIFDNGTIMVSLFIAMYYRSMKSNTDIVISSQILEPAAISLFCLLFSTVFSVVCLFYEMYLKLKSLIGPKDPVSHEKLSGGMTLNDIHVNRSSQEDLAIFVQ